MFIAPAVDKDIQLRRSQMFWSTPTCRRFGSWRLVASIVATSRDIESGDKSPNSKLEAAQVDPYQFFAAASASSSSSLRRQ